MPCQFVGSKCIQIGVNTYPSTAIFQKNVNVFFVLKVVVKLHYMLVMENSVKLYFFVNLKEKARSVLLASLTSEKPVLHMQKTSS